MKITIQKSFGISAVYRKIEGCDLDSSVSGIRVSSSKLRYLHQILDSYCENLNEQTV